MKKVFTLMILLSSIILFSCEKNDDEHTSNYDERVFNVWVKKESKQKFSRVIEFNDSKTGYIYGMEFAKDEPFDWNNPIYRKAKFNISKYGKETGFNMRTVLGELCQSYFIESVNEDSVTFIIDMGSKIKYYSKDFLESQGYTEIEREYKVYE